MFKCINSKSCTEFIQFDISTFRPSFSTNVLNKAIWFSQNILVSLENEIDLILATKKSFFNFDEFSIGKGRTACFDITMGTPNSTRAADVVGIYFPCDVANHFLHLIDCLYYGDCLIYLQNITKKKLLVPLEKHLTQ